ncbi:MAG TPA: beta-phosphoglucomutase [Anaerolineaceae bacterium]|nr:beta-phosphoglucomutase [Anaerolineaceae bacterium]HPN52167.1 beta-phosphoglucomutase [Anaerolineaceae bacterium]
MRRFNAALFDMDGVLIDSTGYHYQAWKAVADSMGFDFTEEDNERLKGVSRQRSLEIVLEVGGRQLSKTAKQRLLEDMNQDYLRYIQSMDEAHLLPGVRACLQALRGRGVKVALGSSSKNAGVILDSLQITAYFDAVIDANKTRRTKPDPQVFLLGAAALGMVPAECVVFEDAQAGIQAAKAAGMFAVGIGKPEVLSQADMVVAGLHQFDVDTLFFPL